MGISIPTNLTELTVELRALMSAEDASSAWNLRCKVRKQFIEYVRNNYPGSSKSEGGN